MKIITLLIVILLMSSCNTKSNEQLIQGEWEISVWNDSRNNTDILKTKDAPKYKIVFTKDSVAITEIEKTKTHNYMFSWSIRQDSLHVSSLGVFKIKELNLGKCKLEMKTRNPFTQEKELHLETLTLIKK